MEDFLRWTSLSLQHDADKHREHIRKITGEGHVTPASSQICGGHENCLRSLVFGLILKLVERVFCVFDTVVSIV